MELERFPSDRASVGVAFVAAAASLGTAAYFMPSILRKLAPKKRSKTTTKSIPVTKQVLINVLEDSAKNIKESADMLDRQITSYRRMLAAQKQKASFPISSVTASERRFFQSLEDLEEKIFNKHGVSKAAVEEAMKKYKDDSDVKTLIDQCNNSVPKFHFTAEEAFNTFKEIQDAQIVKMRAVAEEEAKNHPKGSREFVDAGGRRMRQEAEELKKEMMKDMNVIEPFMEAYIEHYFFTNPRFAKRLKKALRDHVTAIEACGLESGTTLNQSAVEGLDDNDEDDMLPLDAPLKSTKQKMLENKVAVAAGVAAAVVGGGLLLWLLRRESDPFADIDLDF